MKNIRSAGEQGEQLAGEYLENKGYTILAKNWRSGRSEVDIIAMDGSMLVFVEVKTRSGSHEFGRPEEFVNAHKERMLYQAADGYINESSYIGEARFDIVAVQLHRSASRTGNSCISIEHFVDAFYGNG